MGEHVITTYQLGGGGWGVTVTESSEVLRSRLLCSPAEHVYISNPDVERFHTEEQALLAGEKYLENDLTA